ncbi:molybdenum ABC transporter ATP-binding protein [Rhodobacteraceae bacterium KN286]|uniref:Molybdenum ABC transporter ATP-binding protein n=1 Tax=Oceanomicrobium pacificus TaxID=2692916 RepID=A0A6B0TPL5_9RHOB|nr:molybdenum ABC transporter ATP-binding protein [Oceanomicrobium pacificus]
MAGALTGRRGDFPLDLQFDLPGEGITAIFGPSGSGKTSLLRAIAGLDRLDGWLKIGASDWQDGARIWRKPHQRPVGYVFQDARLFPHLSVADNLRFGAERARKGDTRSGPDPDRLIALLGLSGLMARGVQNLSGGERQRVAIGRALLSRPRILLLDEPLSALDGAAKDEIMSYLEDLVPALDIPILYVSHDLAEVARLAQTMAVMKAGRILQSGPVDRLFAELDLEDAAGRFDAGVRLRARVTGQDRAYHLTRLDLGGQQVTVPALDRPDGSEVLLHIRARDVSLALARPEGLSIRNVLEGHITAIDGAAGSPFAEVTLAVGGSALRSRVTREAVDALGLSVGKPVHALVKSISFERGRD